MGILEATSLSIIILSYKDPYSGMRKNRMECGIVLNKNMTEWSHPTRIEWVRRIKAC